VALSFCLLNSAALAQDGGAQPARWKHTWTGYVWVPGTSGTERVGDTRVNVDASISDVINGINNLDASFRGHYEGNKGTRSVILDLMFTRLALESTTDLGRVKLKPESWLAEAAVAYTLQRRPLTPNKMYATLDALGGLRYSRHESNQELITSGGRSRVQQASTWIDPFIGVRYFHDLSSKWQLGGRLDIGGFGVGSDFTWNLLTAVEYRFSRKRSLMLGWRILDQDYDDDEFEWDVEMSGPFLAWRTRL
jgi:hypothetical protein